MVKSTLGDYFGAWQDLGFSVEWWIFVWFNPDLNSIISVEFLLNPKPWQFFTMLYLCMTPVANSYFNLTVEIK
jgi:hypothetical protein